MRPVRLLSLLLGLTLIPWASARVVRVDRDAPGFVQDGNAWATAFLTVQAGLAAATSGGEVWVASGTYPESVSIPPGVSVYGGFAGTETQRGERDIAANPTVLDGGGGGLDAVTCQAEGIVVDGFVIRNGRYGVYVKSGSVTLANNSLSGASYFGVAIAAGTLAMTSSTVSGNVKHGVMALGGSATLTNNTITGNGSDGVSAYFADRVGMSNNIVAFNAGRGVNIASKAVQAFTCNDVYGNPAGNTSGFTPPAGQGNLSEDPLFTDRAAGNYRLQPGSLCIDAGDDAAVSPGSTDLDGAPRILGAHVDLGAYESGSVGPLPFTLADVTKCLSIACGLSSGSAGDLSRLNVVDDSTLDLIDAARLARKVAGLEPNP